MGISSSLNAGVSGLNANANKLATISDNIANSQTYGYKRADIDFSSMTVSDNGSPNTVGRRALVHRRRCATDAIWDIDAEGRADHHLERHRPRDHRARHAAGDLAGLGRAGERRPAFDERQVARLAPRAREVTGSLTRPVIARSVAFEVVVSAPFSLDIPDRRRCAPRRR